MCNEQCVESVRGDSLGYLNVPLIGFSLSQFPRKSNLSLFVMQVVIISTADSCAHNLHDSFSSRSFWKIVKKKMLITISRRAHWCLLMTSFNKPTNQLTHRQLEINGKEKQLRWGTWICLTSYLSTKHLLELVLRFTNQLWQTAQLTA